MLGALQNGCITINHGNLELAETVAKKLVELRPQNDGRYMGASKRLCDQYHGLVNERSNGEERGEEDCSKQYHH